MIKYVDKGTEWRNKEYKMGLGYVWHNPEKDSVGRMCKFKGRHNDIEYHNPFADISNNSLLIFYT